MSTLPINRAGWQSIYRRVVEWQRTTRTESELAARSERDHNFDHDADLPFSRAEAQLEIQKRWWQP
ncbi:MAG TPA: hypothetical protein VFL53_21305 [Pseudolabrys sp.]|nr:hypothetical protein [Pseudolabrys sp.]